MTPEPTGETRALFHISGEAPVIERDLVPDRGAVLPGAVMVDPDGTYHAWVIAFAETPGTQDLHHLTSTDARTWTLQVDDSLAALSEGLGNPGAMPTSVVPFGDGWAMYLTGTLADEQGWDIWMATAPRLDGPWTRGEEPVLRRGEPGAWDAGSLDFPSVIGDAETGFTMFYSGSPASATDTGSVGRATSTDGIEWTKDEAPVVEPGVCGGFDERAVLQPRVVASGADLQLLYAGDAGDADASATRPSVGLAGSFDGGATWACGWPVPALDASGLTGDGVHTIAAFQIGPNPALLVEWLADDGTDVYLAEFGLGGP